MMTDATMSRKTGGWMLEYGGYYKAQE